MPPKRYQTKSRPRVAAEVDESLDEATDKDKDSSKEREARWI